MEQIETGTTGEIRGRGEITIPKKIRELFQLEAGDAVEFIPLGKKALLMTPKPLPLEEARQQFRKILKKTGTTPEELLKGLEMSREETFQEYYGSLTHVGKR